MNRLSSVLMAALLGSASPCVAADPAGDTTGHPPPAGAPSNDTTSNGTMSNGSVLDGANRGLPTQPGHILVATSEIHGWSGMMLIVRATAGSGLVGGRACVQIQSDPFALPFTELMKVPEDQDPCGKGMPPVEFPVGDTWVSARIVRPGEHEPLASVITTVTVNGDTRISLDGMRLSHHPHAPAKTPAQP